MEYRRRQRLSNISAIPISLVASSTVQSSLQTVLPTTALKHEVLKSQKRLLELRQNSQILNPLTLSVVQPAH